MHKINTYPNRWLVPAVLTTFVALPGCADSGHAPRLAGIDDQVAAVGQELVITLQAVDPDGDDIDFAFSSATLEMNGKASVAERPDGTGVFRWTPLADDIGTWFIDFSASDGSGTDTVTALIDVRAAGEGAAPVFREPLGSGTTLDLERAACVSMSVVVEDPDDAQVTLGQGEPRVEGAELVQETGVSGTWNWCPSKAQLEDDRHPITLTADDGVNPFTAKNYLVVLRHPPRPNCPGDAPVVAHEPRNIDSVLDIEIQAQISDDVGLKHAPILYFTTEEPKLPIDFAELDLVEMELASGDMVSGLWTAAIPNPVTGMGKGAMAPLYYIISAGDNDDAEGDCDHVTDAPADGAFYVTISNPGGTGGAGLCEPCSADVQCGGGDDLCVIVGSESESYCLEDCDTNADCDDEFACVPVTSVDGVEAKQCEPLSATCEEPPPMCADDGFEDNDTRAQASGNGELAVGTYNDLAACGGDDDWYRIDMAAEGTLGGLVDGGAASNLNLGLYDADGNPLDLAEGASSLEAVEQCLAAGTYYLRVYAFGAEDNTYDLLVEETPGSCAATCTDDSHEDDDNAAQATYAEVWPSDYNATTRMICSGDDDWYEVELYTDETVVVDLTFTHGGVSEDLDLHFHSDDGTDLTPCTEEAPQTCSAAQGQSATSNEHFEHTVTQTGCAPCTFYVSVHGFAGSESDYDINIGLL